MKQKGVLIVALIALILAAIAVIIQFVPLLAPAVEVDDNRNYANGDRLYKGTVYTCQECGWTGTIDGMSAPHYNPSDPNEYYAHYYCPRCSEYMGIYFL